MCGIVGYVGNRPAEALLIDGLRRLEYRGYDSAGIAVANSGNLQVRKSPGRIADLRKLLDKDPTPGTSGIGHTRWATHGPPNQVNAHPHLGGDGSVAVVHNGIIENYVALRKTLTTKGFKFVSETDTEVISHLIAHCLEATTGDFATRLVKATELALEQLKGTYGVAVFSAKCPDVLIGARSGSPLIVGVGKGENFLASDQSALANHTQNVIFLNDGELVILTKDNCEVRHRDGRAVQTNVSKIEFTSEDTELGKFPHYMLKEIYEQPDSTRNAMRGRLDEDNATALFGGLNLTPAQLRQVNRIILTGCGTSWHAGLVGEYLIEDIAGIPVEVEYASELRYRNPPLDPGTILFSIAQSGETADTLAALRESKRKGIPTLGIVNVVGSTIARECDGGIYLHAGPEIGVASTKSFTAQVTVLGMLALYLGRMRRLSMPVGKRIIEQMRTLPDRMSDVLKQDDKIKQIAKKYSKAQSFLFLGRGNLFPIALEGALKMKETSYVHAHGYPAAEIKHGPIALVDAEMPTVVLIPRGALYEKTMSSLEEIKARKGKVIAIATEGDKLILEKADDVIYIPDIVESLQPLLSVIPLQFLAYHMAVIKGCDVDKPRNLAKSVTVE